MAHQQRLESLERQHAAVQAQIALEEQSLQGDDRQIRTLKQKRLKLKDEMATLGQHMAAESYSASSH